MAPYDSASEYRRGFFGLAASSGAPKGAFEPHDHLCPQPQAFAVIGGRVMLRADAEEVLLARIARFDGHSRDLVKTRTVAIDPGDFVGVEVAIADLLLQAPAPQTTKIERALYASY